MPPLGVAAARPPAVEFPRLAKGGRLLPAGNVLKRGNCRNIAWCCREDQIQDLCRQLCHKLIGIPAENLAIPFRLTASGCRCSLLDKAVHRCTPEELKGGCPSFSGGNRTVRRCFGPFVVYSVQERGEEDVEFLLCNERLLLPEGDPLPDSLDPLGVFK